MPIISGNRSARRLGALLVVLSLCLAARPANSPWATTRLDATASVDMPYAGTEESAEEDFLQVKRFFTSTSDNDFEVWRFALADGAKTKQGQDQTLVFDMDKYLRRYLALTRKKFSKAKLQSEHPVTVPSAPGALGFHRVYYGFDEFKQEPAVLELTWVTRGDVVYLFNCSNLLPEEDGAREDKQHFFTTIHFDTQ